MKLHNMKRTKTEMKSNGGCDAPTCSSSKDPYPYGLEISLEKESIEKLGLDIDDFSIGGKVNIMCIAEITSLSQSASKNNENLNVRLQITDMGMGECKMENPKKLREVTGLLKKMKE